MSETLDSRVFRDDDAAGFALRVVRGPDGDFWLSILPNDDMPLAERLEPHNAGLYSAGIRVRMPMIGGGSHDALYMALVGVFKKTKPPASSRAPSAERSQSDA